MKLINIGYGNTVNSDRVVAAVSADAATAQRCRTGKAYHIGGKG